MFTSFACLRREGEEGRLADVVINHNDTAGVTTVVPPDGAPEDGGSEREQRRHPYAGSDVVDTFGDCFATRPRTTEAGGGRGASQGPEPASPRDERNASRPHRLTAEHPGEVPRGTT